MLKQRSTRIATAVAVGVLLAGSAACGTPDDVVMGDGQADKGALVAALERLEADPRPYIATMSVDANDVADAMPEPGSCTSNPADEAEAMGDMPTVGVDPATDVHWALGESGEAVAVWGGDETYLVSAGVPGGATTPWVRFDEATRDYASMAGMFGGWGMATYAFIPALMIEPGRVLPPAVDQTDTVTPLGDREFDGQTLTGFALAVDPSILDEAAKSSFDESGIRDAFESNNTSDTSGGVTTDTTPHDESAQFDEFGYESTTESVDAEVWLDGDDIARVEIIGRDADGEFGASTMRLTYSFGDDVVVPTLPDAAQVTDAATLPAEPFADTTGLMEQFADMGQPVCDLDGDGAIDEAPQESPLDAESTDAMMDCFNEAARQQAAGKTLGELAKEGGDVGTMDPTAGLADDPSMACMTSMLDDMPSLSDLLPTDGSVDPAVQACFDAMENIDLGAILSDPESMPENGPPECEGLDDDQLFGAVGTEPSADPTAESPATTAAP